MNGARITWQLHDSVLTHCGGELLDSKDWLLFLVHKYIFCFFIMKFFCFTTTTVS
jgi:hypothetical protein